MANGLLSYINRCDLSAAVLSTDSEVATLPAANITDPVIQKVWQTQAASAFFQFDFGSALSVGLLALFGCSFGSSDTVRHRLSASTPGGGDLLDTGAVASGVQSGYGVHVYKLSAAVNARYWRCDIAASAVFQVGRAWAGPFWSFARNFAPGYAEMREDLSVVTVAERSAVEYVDLGPQFRIVEFNLAQMSTADRDEARDLERLAGRNAQVVLVPDPGSATVAKEAIIGRVALMTPIITPREVSNLYAKSFRIRESK